MDKTIDEKKLRLAEALSYTDDIKPHRFIQLYSGVGSGKNYYIDRLIEGHTDERHDGTKITVPPMTVLLITSRRAKVDEILTGDELTVDGSIGRWSEYHRILDEDLGKIPVEARYLEDAWGRHCIYQRSVACTNAFIEIYMKMVYNPVDITTHLWELFDMIVVDEAHSLVVDATYQSAPFYVNELINEYHRRCRLADEQPETFKRPSCKHLMLMTGSPDPIAGIAKDIEWKKIDMFEKCINVVPENIHFILHEDVKRRIEAQIKKGGRVLYFSNHTLIPSSFCEKTGINPDDVGCSFSNEERRKKLKKKDSKAYDKMLEIEESLHKEGKIPQKIRLLLTTSKNKEGININDTDIDYLYVETHLKCDVIQMAGRIRKGVKHMYIILDAVQYQEQGWINEADFCKRLCKEAKRDNNSVLGRYASILCKRNQIDNLLQEDEGMQLTAYSKGCEPIAQYIDYIHDKFPYIRYSYLTNRFCYYALRQVGENYCRAMLGEFDYLRETPEEYSRLLREWFPKTRVSVLIPNLDKGEDGAAKKALEFFRGKGYEDSSVRITKQEMEVLRKELNLIFGTSVVRINPLLRRFTELECVRVSRDKTNSLYEIYHFRTAKTA